MNLTIISNGHPRPLLTMEELTQKEQEAFDYVSPDDYYSPRFVRYRNWVYDAFEFQRAPSALKEKGWAGYHGDSFFSGVVLRWGKDGSDPDFETVVMGRYYS